MDTRNFNLRALIYRADDAPHIWVAHCLELDVISQGATPGQASDAIREAVEMTLLDDLNAGLDPFGRRPAPAEIHEQWADLYRRGRMVDLSQADVAEREQVSCFGVQHSFSFQAQRATILPDAGPTFPVLAAANGCAA